MREKEVSLWQRFCNKLTQPLKVDPIALLLFFVLSSGAQIVERSCGSLGYGIYMAVFAFLQFYLFFWIITSFPRFYRLIKPVLAVFLVLCFSFSLFCYVRFGLIFLPDFLSIIIATNSSEVQDFMRMYVLPQHYVFFVCILLSVAFVYNLSERLRFSINTRIQKIVSILLILFTLAIARNNHVMSVYWEGMRSFDFDHVVDLSLYFSNPDIDCDTNTLPERVVVIIGESFTSAHSSLYGYSLCTNPELEQLRQDSLLFVFDQVCSPATHTIQSFKLILNTQQRSDSTKTKWYRSLTLIELLSKLNYHTNWLSNQGESGFYDCLSTSFARICDYSCFTGSLFQEGYDEQLISIDIPNESRQAVFYHLMGQHGAFDNRYPKNYDVFNEAQYIEYPSHQIEPRRTYDNATLYNDYVCSSLFRKFQDQDAIGFYFPDHGQDFYDVDDDFYGHGRIGIAASVEAARRIPFMVYVSPLFRQRHPDIVEEIIKKQKEPMCTDAFIFLFMHLLNVKLTSAC